MKHNLILNDNLSHTKREINHLLNENVSHTKRNINLMMKQCRLSTNKDISLEKSTLKHKNFFLSKNLCFIQKIILIGPPSLINVSYLSTTHVMGIFHNYQRGNRLMAVGIFSDFFSQFIETKRAIRIIFY